MKSYGYARDNEQRGGFQNQNRPNQFQPMERKEEVKKSFFQKNQKTIVVASVAVAAVSTAVTVKLLHDTAVSRKAVEYINSMYPAIKKANEELKQEQKEEPAVESEETKK